MKIRALEFLLFLVILATGIFFFISFYEEQRILSHTPPVQRKFPEIALEAKAAYVWDAKDNKELFAYNENESRPLASVTKLMTALTAWESLSTSTVVTITKHDLSP